MATAALIPDRAPDLAEPSAIKAKSERCGTCRFWREAGDSELGDCRRWPPVILAPAIEDTLMENQLSNHGADVPRDIHTASRFPATYSGDWCGEFDWLPTLEPIRC